MSFYMETNKIAEAKGYAVFELAEKVGGRSFTLWGPDINGRFCRNGAYFSLHDAMNAFRAITRHNVCERDNQDLCHTCGKPVQS